MKKSFCVFIIFLLAYSSVVGSEELKKASPARDFIYKLDKKGQGVIITEYIGKDTEVTIPAIIKTFPVVEIRNESYKYYVFPESVTKVNLPKSLEIIGEWAFNSSGIETITIPDSVKKIEYAGLACKNLKTVKLGNRLEVIGERAFEASKIESITVPDSVKVIEKDAFRYCKNLKIVTIGSGIRYIGDCAFDTCNQLTTFTLGVKKIPIEPFECLGKEYISGGYGGYGRSYPYGVFSGCSNLSLESQENIRLSGYKSDFDYK